MKTLDEMIDTEARLISMAAKNAIDGVIEIERWKFCQSVRNPWRRGDVEFMWRRKSSAKRLLAKSRDGRMNIETIQDDDGSTVWALTYWTDPSSSYCRYTFRTPQPQAFYAQAVAASEERRAIEPPNAKPVSREAMRL